MTPSLPLLAAQAVATAGLAWPGRPMWNLPQPALVAAGAAAAAGGGLAVAGAAVQGRQLSEHVEPPPGARLRTSGPYRFSRHPIYAGVLLAGAGVAVLRRRVEPLVSLAALGAVLHLKARAEERWLLARFPDYEEYAARTPRVLGLAGPQSGEAHRADLTAG